jgi:hypothetical protein
MRVRRSIAAASRTEIYHEGHEDHEVCGSNEVLSRMRSRFRVLGVAFGE